MTRPTRAASSFVLLDEAFENGKGAVGGRVRVARSLDTLLLPLAEAIGNLVCHADFERVKSCENPSCTLWFHDVSITTLAAGAAWLCAVAVRKHLRTEQESDPRESYRSRTGDLWNKRPLLTGRQSFKMHISQQGHDKTWKSHGFIFDTVGGPPLGVLPSLSFEQHTVELAKGDTVLLYTDGIIDARDPNGALFGIEGLESTMSLGGGGAQGTVNAIRTALARHQHRDRHRDDQTLVAMHIVD